MSPITSRYDLLQKRLERFTRLLPRVEAGDVRAIHHTRVVSRRLRELLPVLCLDVDTSDKLIRRLRKVTHHLGPVRELDVLQGTVDDLREADRYPSSVLNRIAAAIRGDRKQVERRRRGNLPTKELGRIAARLAKVAEQIHDEATGSGGSRDAKARSCAWAVEARVARRAATLMEAVEAAGAVYLPDRLHTVRIAVKKLRYAVELSMEVGGSSSASDLKQLRQMQDLLGQLHDLQVLIDRVRRMQGVVATPDLVSWAEIDRVIIGLENDCRRLHARYMRDRDALVQLAGRLAHRSRGGSAKRAAADRVNYA